MGRLLLVFALTLGSSGLTCWLHAMGGVIQKSWNAGSWDGEHGFLDVYCLRFPHPETALSSAEGFVDSDAVHLTRVEYPDRMMANVVVSSIPDGRTPAEEMNRLLEIERSGERHYNTSYNINRSRTDLGDTIGLRIKNVAPAGRSGPFPLVRAMFGPGTKPLASLSVHRLFVRGSDRFEIAVYQMAPDPSREDTEAEMTERLTGFADEMVRSLQSCTARLRPSR